MSAMIELDRLTKRFGALVAVDDVSMAVARGEVREKAHELGEVDVHDSGGCLHACVWRAVSGVWRLVCDRWCVVCVDFQDLVVRGGRKQLLPGSSREEKKIIKFRKKLNANCRKYFIRVRKVNESSCYFI